MNQEAFEFLNAIRKIDYEIQCLNCKKSNLESCLLPSGIRYDKDKIQGSYENQIEKIMGQLDIVNNTIARLYSKRYDMSKEIEDVISQVEQLHLRTILYHRYVSPKSINKIAEIMNYSPDWVYKNHRKAVDEVGKILKARENVSIEDGFRQIKEVLEDGKID